MSETEIGILLIATLLMPIAIALTLFLRARVSRTEQGISNLHGTIRRLYFRNHQRVTHARRQGIPVPDAPIDFTRDLQRDARNPEQILAQTPPLRDGDGVGPVDSGSGGVGPVGSGSGGVAPVGSGTGTGGTAASSDESLLDHAKQLKRMLSDLYDLARQSGVLDTLSTFNYAVLVLSILGVLGGAITIKLGVGIAILIASIIALVLDIVAKIIGSYLNETHARQLKRLLAEAKEKGVELEIPVEE